MAPDDTLPAPYVPAIGDRCEVVLPPHAGRIGRVREVRPDGMVVLAVPESPGLLLPWFYLLRVPALALRPAKVDA